MLSRRALVAFLLFKLRTRKDVVKNVQFFFSVCRSNILKVKGREKLQVTHLSIVMFKK